ncbi:MAG: histidine--tRNA ligase [Dysgonamonadaceae bacterium]|jgi:histidyl-tRNA synthetase|nr:histidine--tRNA ligase [Dysgonamonadaceae bacterium]
MQKPAIPKGTRDFSPQETAKRNYIFKTIQDVYHLYGFEQIETPAMENLSTLMGKYGEEGDKLLFKILNSGDYLASTDREDLLTKNSLHLTNQISEKGLRYDLTVPFARYVVMHRNELTFPFKRFQIQAVWRADRPQKGLYREFFQCDADVAGSDSLLNEVELIQIMDEVFRRFGIRVCIKVNNRKILSGIAEIIGEPEKITDITVAIDKMDKIGLENVHAELSSKGISSQAIEQLQPIINLSGSNREKLATLKHIFSGAESGSALNAGLKTAASETGLKGVEELEFIFDKTDALGTNNALELDLTLARGLNYYTGAIFEVKALDVQIGSISGGGRYDNLTGVFGLPGISGVGISFGADRIFDVLNRLELYPAESICRTQILFVNFGDKEEAYIFPIIKQLRAKGIRSEIYPESAKINRQMSYANAKQIPCVVIAGENEINEGKLTVKDMTTGKQQLLTPSQLLDSFD